MTDLLTLQDQLPGKLSQGQEDCYRLLEAIRPAYNHPDPDVASIAHATAVKLYQAMHALASLEKLIGDLP